MKIKYVGKKLETAFIPEMGIVQKDKIYDVSDDVANAFVESGDFERVTPMPVLSKGSEA